MITRLQFNNCIKQRAFIYPCIVLSNPHTLGLTFSLIRLWRLSYDNMRALFPFKQLCSRIHHNPAFTPLWSTGHQQKPTFDSAFTSPHVTSWPKLWPPQRVKKFRPLPCWFESRVFVNVKKFYKLFTDDNMNNLVLSSVVWSLEGLISNLLDDAVTKECVPND